MKKLILVLNIMFCINGFAADYTVYPLFIELDQADKKSQNFEIKVKADGAMKVQASLYKSSQLRNGKLQFEKVGIENIQIKKDTHVFTRKGVWSLEGKYTFSNKNSTDVYAVKSCFG